MKKILLAFTLSISLTAGAQTAFTPGNIVVCRVGDGTAALMNTGAPVFLDEYNSAGTLVQTLAMPADSTDAIRLILSGTNNTEGTITRSPDGKYIAMVGYDAAYPNGSSLSGSSAATVNRVISWIDSAANRHYLALDDYMSGNSPRSAITTDGTSFWMVGGAQGISYVSTNDTVTASICTIASPSVTSFRYVVIADGNLYTSTTMGTGVERIGKVGTGLPTTSGQAYAGLNGVQSSGAPHQFFFADLDSNIPGVDVLYFAEETSAIKKYSFNGSSWSMDGTIGNGADEYRAVAGRVSGDTVYMYATRKAGKTATGGGELVMVTDVAGHAATPSSTDPTLIATVASNTAIRGLAFVPGNIATTDTTATTSVKNIKNEADALLVFPNPAKGLITCEHPASPAFITIKAIDGRVVNTLKVAAADKHTSIDINQLSTGFYILGFQGEGIHLTKSFVKQ